MSEFPTINRIAITLSTRPRRVSTGSTLAVTGEMTLAEIQQEATVFLPAGRSSRTRQPDSPLFQGAARGRTERLVHRPTHVAKKPIVRDVQEVLHDQVSAMVFDLGSGQIVREGD